MDSEIPEWLGRFAKAAEGRGRGRGATDAEIGTAEGLLGVTLPDDLKDFYRWSDGWDGFYGEAPLQIDALVDLQSHNDPQFRQLYPGVIAIGGNGGLETYALDYRGGSTSSGLVAFDAIAGLESALRIAESFAEALDMLRTNYLGPWQ
jgi:hypothetical protein